MNKICTSFNSIICLQIKYNLQTFIPKLKWSILDTYFDNLEIQSAEDNVCNFERHSKWALVGDTAMSQYRPTP